MWCLIHCSSMVTSSEYCCQRSDSSCSHSERSKVNPFRCCAKKRELMLRKRRTHVGFDTVLNIWYSGHDIIQGWDICDDGFLIWMGHIHICRNREWKNIPPLYGVYVIVSASAPQWLILKPCLNLTTGNNVWMWMNISFTAVCVKWYWMSHMSVSSLTFRIQQSGDTQLSLRHAEGLLQVLLVALSVH